MDKQRFKQMLVRDKQWLKELYESDTDINIKRLLNFASDAKLETLMKFIHLISNGEIKMTRENFDKIEKRQLKIIKKEFESKRAIKRLLQSERSVKIRQLNKLVKSMRLLLFTLFNRN